MLETIASHLDAIAALAPTWGLLFVFVFMAVESSFIPFPSEVVMVPAGFLAARGELALAPVPALAAAIAVGVLGSLAGAFANYYLALWLGRPFLERYGKYFFVKPEPLARACEVFNRYGAATTFVCRLVPVIRQLIYSAPGYGPRYSRRWASRSDAPLRTSRTSSSARAARTWPRRICRSSSAGRSRSSRSISSHRSS